MGEQIVTRQSSARNSDSIAETSWQMGTFERDDSAQVYLDMEARPAAAIRSKDRDGDFTLTQAQVETQQESLGGHEAQGETLEDEIENQRKRRRSLREMQKDMVSSMNAYAVVLVLLVSVTFMGFLQPPGGLDDRGYLKRRGGRMRRYIFYDVAAFYFAVAGILTCMSCIAFVLPRATAIAGSSPKLKMKRKSTSVEPGLNSDMQTILDFEVKNNDKMSRTLRLAFVLEVLANLFFMVSLLFTIEAFRKSARIVIEGDALNIFHSHFYWKILDRFFKVICYLYIGVLVLNIVLAVKDLIVDTLKTVKGLSPKSFVRIRTSRSFQ